MLASFSLKALFRTGVVFITLALLIVGGGSLYFLHQSIDISDELIEDSLSETRMVVTLQLAMSQAAMPPNDHIIHANPAEQENYRALVARVGQQFSQLAASESLLPQQREILAAARREWREARTLGDAIMALQDPKGDSRAAGMMEQFDSHVEKAVHEMETINELVRQETVERDEALHRLRLTASTFIITLFLLGLAVASVGSMALARALFPSLRTLAEGMRRFSRGNLDTRIETPMPAEFQQLGEGFNTMAGRLQALHDRLESESIRDSMTGCYNHRKFINDFHFEMGRTRRYQHPLTLLMLDIDHFKTVNDTHGHPAGDEVLRVLTREISGHLRETDALYRYGGEEFAILLTETDGPGARLVAERLRALIEKMTVRISDDTSLSITVSIGIAYYPDDAGDEDSLLKVTDQALYRAKTNGRNRVCHGQDICTPQLT
jgi:diguanylate cyclase (GGDEF)-like protein